MSNILYFIMYSLAQISQQQDNSQRAVHSQNHDARGVDVVHQVRADRTRPQHRYHLQLTAVFQCAFFVLLLPPRLRSHFFSFFPFLPRLYFTWPSYSPLLAPQRISGSSSPSCSKPSSCCTASGPSCGGALGRVQYMLPRTRHLRWTVTSCGKTRVGRWRF